MPLASVRARMARQEPNADPVYWEWAVDGADYNDADGLTLLNATLSGLQEAVGLTGSGLLVDMDCDLIEIFPGGGGPAYYVQGFGTDVPIGSSSTGNHILQCAVSELVSTPRGTAARGRMFVGPVAGGSSGTMSTSLRTLAVGIMQEVASAHIDAGYTPVVISKFSGTDPDGNPIPRGTPVGIPVTGFRADLRWDILVSRRIPTDSQVDFPLLPAA